MKAVRLCFTVALLLLGVCRADTMMPEDESDSTPLLTSADAIAPPKQEEIAPTSLDKNSEEQARLDTQLLPDSFTDDPKARRREIADRDANIPGVNQSMDDIFGEVVEHLKQINCARPKPGKVPEQEFLAGLIEPHDTPDPYSLCDADIAPVVFMPLSDPSSSKSSIFRHFRDNIYQPLGYEFPSDRFSVADTIQDLIGLDPDNSAIHRDMQALSFRNFSALIGEAFKSIETASTDFDRNKGTISRQMVDVLKAFHVFWNVLRQKNRLGQTKTQTLTIVRQMIRKFRSTHAAMKAATLNVLENVKEAYFRFMRAHKYQRLVSKRPQETLAFQILERYKANVVKIRDRAADSTGFVSEISVFLDLLKAFHAVNRQKRLTAEESLAAFEQKIATPIAAAYNVFQDAMVRNSDDSFYKVREFTAVLLLKMKHRNHVMSRFFGWEEYFRSRSTDDRTFDNAVKFYEELVDAVMLVPSSCDTAPAKPACVREHFDTELGTLSRKYLLQASISGVGLYRYVQNALEKAASELTSDDDENDENDADFRQRFVKVLSATFRKFRADFHINDMSDVEELENSIGFQIEKAKSAAALAPLDLALVESFDKTLYTFFLDVKSAYNAYAPVGKDARVLNSISQRLEATIATFKAQHARQLTRDTTRLMQSAIHQSKLWIRKHSVQYVVNTHPVNVRVEPLLGFPEAENIGLPEPGAPGVGRRRLV